MTTQYDIRVTLDFDTFDNVVGFGLNGKLDEIVGRRSSASGYSLLDNIRDVSYTFKTKPARDRAFKRVKQYLGSLKRKGVVSTLASEDATV